MNLPGITRAGDRVLQAATDPFPDPAGAPPAAAVPADQIEGALRLRPLRPGDRMRYRGFRRKVSGILKNERVPRWERGGLIAVAGREDVVAVLGLDVAISDGCEGDDCYYFRLAPPAPPLSAASTATCGRRVGLPRSAAASARRRPRPRSPVAAGRTC